MSEGMTDQEALMIGESMPGDEGLARITRSVERIRSSAESELRLLCATERQSISSQPFGVIWAGIPLWHDTCGVSGTRDRAADMRTRKSGNRRRIFHENRNNARNDTIRLG
jgi:hypothetical protein